MCSFVRFRTNSGKGNAVWLHSLLTESVHLQQDRQPGRSEPRCRPLMPEPRSGGVGRGRELLLLLFAGQVGISGMQCFRLKARGV
jgi:hypothetical protein